MSATRSLIHPRDELLATMQRIYRYRMTTTSGGNLSLRDERGATWITPARIDKGALRRDDIVCVGTDGRVDGPHRPSSELPFHQAIYAARPDVRAVVHAHPVALVAFSVVGQAPDTRLLHQARRVCGPVGFAPYALPGSEALGRSLAATFAQGHECVVLENHGVVVAGETLAEAFQRFETLEFVAQTLVKARQLGPVRMLGDEQLATAARAPRALPTIDPPPATGAEQELRRQLVDFVRRGYQQRLLISTGGTFSARLGEDAFLITPFRADRHTLDLDDVVLVSGGRAESGKTPSRATALHRALYARHPQVHSIANAYPASATAFCVTDARLDSRTIPESYLFLRDIERIPYGLQFTGIEQLVERVGPRAPIALLENDGVLVLGTSVLDAFDRLEVLESTAEALIHSRALGAVSPMSDAVLDELRRAFFPEE